MVVNISNNLLSDRGGLRMRFRNDIQPLPWPKKESGTWSHALTQRDTISSKGSSWTLNVERWTSIWDCLNTTSHSLLHHGLLWLLWRIWRRRHKLHDPFTDIFRSGNLPCLYAIPLYSEQSYTLQIGSTWGVFIIHSAYHSLPEIFDRPLEMTSRLPKSKILLLIRILVTHLCYLPCALKDIITSLLLTLLHLFTLAHS